MYLKIHKSYRNVVSLCDKELIGKIFEEGKLQLDIRENFYLGEEVSEEKAVEQLKKQVLEGAIFNIIGDKSIKTAEKAHIITSNYIGKIQNIPYALTFI